MAKIKKVVKKLFGIAYWGVLGFFFRLLPLKKNNIYFESFLGRYFSDNPRALYEYMVENNYQGNFTFIWGFKQKESHSKLEFVKQVKRMRIKYLYYISTSKYIVNNSRMPLGFKKRKNQIYIQTWHGTPLKRLVHDMDEVLMPGADTQSYKENFNKDIKKWDYLVTPNEYATEKFKTAFKYNGNLLKSGYPRNDILKSDNRAKSVEIKEKLDIAKDKIVLLYTPTFRDNKFASKGNYIQEINFDIQKIKEINPNIIFLLRTHYLVTKIDFKHKWDKNDYIDVSKYDDISELYLISDMLITDYSSTFFDFSILNRPIVFYQYDYKEYKDDMRGFYINEDQLPSKPIYNAEELYNDIKVKISEPNKYNKKYLELHTEEYQKKSSEYICKEVFQK